MNQRDIERLSEYLDGRLDPSDSARLETRLASDLALASALDALRDSRALLRRMPKRRAPRNFTLTRKMVGLKPPLPRTYPVFRFATALATILFALSFVRFPVIGFGAAAPAPAAYGTGGGGDAPTEAPLMEMAVATEPPVATEAPAESPSTPLPASTEMATAPQDVTPETEGNRAIEPPSAKSTDTSAPASPLLSAWQIAIGSLALLGAAGMFTVRQLAARKWRAK